MSGEDVVDYNRFDPIADQAVRRDMEIVTDPNRILIRTERFRALGALQDGNAGNRGDVVPDRFDIRCYAICNLPPRWAPWETRQARSATPISTSSGCPVRWRRCSPITYPDEQAATSRAAFKFMRTTSLANSQSANSHRTRDQSREWEYVQDQLRQGQKPVRVFYSVMSVSPMARVIGTNAT